MEESTQIRTSTTFGLIRVMENLNEMAVRIPTRWCRTMWGERVLPKPSRFDYNAVKGCFTAELNQPTDIVSPEHAGVPNHAGSP
jgi:hypothetical protein